VSGPVTARALALLLLLLAAPATAAETALYAATLALDRALATGLTREAFHGLHRRLVSEADAAGSARFEPAIGKLLAAAAAADAIWRDEFTGSLCSDPDEMDAALGELRSRVRQALAAVDAAP
jgi:hypothetical protein